MCRYRVIFFKVLLGIDGHPDKYLQQSIVIRRARSAERAVEAAKRRYERRCRVADWRLHADGFEMEIDLLKDLLNLSKKKRGASPLTNGCVKQCSASEELRKWQRSFRTILISTSTLRSIGRCTTTTTIVRTEHSSFHTIVNTVPEVSPSVRNARR